METTKKSSLNILAAILFVIDEIISFFLNIGYTMSFLNVIVELAYIFIIVLLFIGLRKSITGISFIIYAALCSVLNLYYLILNISMGLFNDYEANTSYLLNVFLNFVLHAAFIIGGIMIIRMFSQKKPVKLWFLPPIIVAAKLTYNLLNDIGSMLRNWMSFGGFALDFLSFSAVILGFFFAMKWAANVCSSDTAVQADFPVNAETAYQAPASPAIVGQTQSSKDFSGVTVRHRCPNGHTFDGTESMNACPHCGAMLEKGGYIQLYRMGNFVGCAVGMDIHIDRIGYGMIGNTQSLRISVPYGQHLLHVTHTATRKCNDPIVMITPDAPVAYCKAHFTKGGFAIAVEPASPDEMPDK